MTEYLQIHMLTSYPPSNLNRDDLGRPKTAVMGGEPRLRISSQSLKRAWRTSEIFKTALDGHVGTRTKEMGRRVKKSLLEAGVKEKAAVDAAQKIAGVFGKLKKDTVDIEQLAHFSPEERKAVEELTRVLAEEKRVPTDDEVKLLRKEHRAADIALFGRMLAADPEYNTEAAAQVAHAITVHRTVVEDDFFSAVDDLNLREEDMGAGHLGETEFAAGLFYLYVCVNRDLLVENLSGDENLARNTLRAFTEAAAKVAPTGKQNSFASRAYASYILAEKGHQQPRSLSVAFLHPVQRGDFLGEAIKELKEKRQKMDAVYGATWEDSCELDANAGEGSLQDLLDFVAEPLSGVGK